MITGINSLGSDHSIQIGNCMNTTEARNNVSCARVLWDFFQIYLMQPIAHIYAPSHTMSCTCPHIHMYNHIYTHVHTYTLQGLWSMTFLLTGICTFYTIILAIIIWNI